MAKRTASRALTKRARQIAKKTSQKPVPRSGAGTAVMGVPLSPGLDFSTSVLVERVATSSLLMFALDILGTDTG